MSVGAWRERFAAGLLVSLVLAGCAPAAVDGGPEEDAEEDADALRVCAAGPTVEGIDVSYWQGAIDWSAVAGTSVEFAIVRVSDGATFKDPRWQENWAGARDAGLMRGVYQYFRPNQDPLAQAQLLLDALEADPLRPNDLPPVLDIETTSGMSTAKVRARMQVWLDAVESATGRRPLVYTAAFMQNVVGSEFSDYPLWVANYTKQCPLMPSGWDEWVMWQYTESGKVAGIKGSVDRNVFNGSLDDLLTFASGGKPNDDPADPPVEDPPADPPADPPVDPAAPTSLAPADGSSFDAGSVTMSCAAFEGAKSYAFEIQLYDEAAQDWAGYYTYSTSSNQKTFWPASDGAYRFRVRATTTEGTSPDSAWSRFTYGDATLP